MGIISRAIKIIGDKGEREVNALFDSGASASFIKHDIVKEVATIIKMPRERGFTLGNGEGTLRTPYVTNLDFNIKDWTIFDRILVVDKLGEELIIGADIMQRWKMKLDFEKEDILIDPKVFDFKLIKIY